MSDVSWGSAEDFGQKVDLTVRIREILRNYPEGLSILKELIQNADDAGARTMRFCTAEPRHVSAAHNSNDALSELMKGPSLLCYNSAKFTDTDFKSIQRIGDSLKKDKNGTKTGRFGVGVNSTYHLTDVPVFVSGSKVVMFDPQASFVPGINPANPGKMIDCSKASGRSLIQSLPHVFDPLKVFGCNLSGEEFDGTIFRFALRTEAQAEVSRLSRQAHLWRIPGIY
jgi:sacsin